MDNQKFRANALNCGYRLLIILKQNCLNVDIIGIIVRLLHELLDTTLREKCIEICRIRFAKCHNIALSLLNKFIIGNSHSTGEIRMPFRQRQLIQILCEKVPELGITCSTTTTTHHQGGSKTRCKCGATGKTDYYDLYDDESYNSDESDDYHPPCSVCEESGYVRNFITTSLTVNKQNTFY